MTGPDVTAGLPEPTDRSAAWHGDVPAYLAWWWALVDHEHVHRYVEAHRLTQQYAEAVPSIEALDALTGLGPLLEIGAGAGYWARLLRDRGADVLAVDLPEGHPRRWDREAPWTDVEDSDHRAVVEHTDRTPFVCWPPRPSGFATDVVQLAPQRALALVTVGPMTGLGSPDPLWEALEIGGWELERRVNIPMWPMRGDHLTIWAR